MKRHSLLMTSTLVCLIIGSTIVLSAGSQERSSEPQDRLEIEASTIQAGVMTEKQGQHSKLYNQYDSERKIQDLLNLEDDDIHIRRSLPFRFGSPDQTRSDVDEIKRITCAADAIVVATVKHSASQITASQSFVFTDYGLLVQEVLRNNTPEVIHQESEISVTRPGGAVLVDGRRITAIDESFLPLRRGNQYLLFLRYLPETESFASIETGESYELSATGLQLLKGPSGQSKDLVAAKNNAISLVNEIRAVTNGPCK
jgi:hypothetical protein